MPTCCPALREYRSDSTARPHPADSAASRAAPAWGLAHPWRGRAHVAMAGGCGNRSAGVRSTVPSRCSDLRWVSEVRRHLGGRRGSRDGIVLEWKGRNLVQRSRNAGIPPERCRGSGASECHFRHRRCCVLRLLLHHPLEALQRRRN